MSDNPYAAVTLGYTDNTAPKDNNPPEQTVPSFQSEPNTSSNPYAAVTLGGPGSSAPEDPTQHDESDRFTQEDPGANWLEKSWNFLNKPLTESVLGWGAYRSGAGGVERAIEKMASGLTSPLSLLTFAAFAPAGLVEGVAGNTLKEGLMVGEQFLGGEALDLATASTKVEQYAKAVNLAKKAQVAGTPIDEAVKAVGLDYEQYKTFGEYLRNQGMRETDMLSEGLGRRIASRSLVKAGLSDAQALRYAKAAETMVNMGFGIQQLKGASIAYPRAMDLMAQGDVDGAAEAITEASVGTFFGIGGLAHGFHAAQDVLPTMNEKEDLPLTEESARFVRERNLRDRDIISGHNGVQKMNQNLLAGMFKLAKIDVPSRLGIGDWSDYSFGDEIMSSLRDIKNANNTSISNILKKIGIESPEVLTSASDSLLKTQKIMLTALETGADSDKASTVLHAYAYATGQEQWLKDQGYVPKFTIKSAEDIATKEIEEATSNRASATIARENIYNISSNITSLESQKESLAKEISSELDPEKQKSLQDRLKIIQQTIDNKISEKQEAEAYLPEKEEKEKLSNLWTEHEKAREEILPQIQAVTDIENSIKTLEDPRTKISLESDQNRVQGRIKELESLIKNSKGSDKSILENTLGQARIRLETLKDQINKTSPEAVEDIKKSLESARSNLDKVKGKSDSTREAAFREHFYSLKDHLVEAFKDVDKNSPINAFDQFNKKVEALGFNPSDIELIRNEYPDMPWSRDYIAPTKEVPETGKNIIPSNILYKHEIPDSEKSILRKSIESTEKRIRDTVESKDPNAILRTRTLLKSLNHLRRALNGMGEVRGLPDGKKVLYLSPESIGSLNHIVGLSGGWAGQAVPKTEIYRWKNIFDTSSFSEASDLNTLINKATNSDGSVIIATDNRGVNGPSLSMNLHTLREELTHGWQHSLNESFRDHLNEEDFNRLHASMPQGMKKYLNKIKAYKNTSNSGRVIEATAKLMTDPPSKYDVTPEEAEKYLHDYFTAVKEKHGEGAFDSLIHITKQAKEIKERFLNAGKEPERSDEGTVGSVGERETSRGPKEEGPRKPPTIPRVPPEEIEQFRKEHIAQLENNLAKAQEEYSKILSTDDYRKTARAIKNFEDARSALEDFINTRPNIKDYAPDFYTYFKEHEGQIRESGLTNSKPIPPWADRPIPRDFTSTFEQDVEKAKKRDWTQDIEYHRSMMEAYRAVAEGLNPEQKSFFKILKDNEQKNWEAAYNADTILVN